MVGLTSPGLFLVPWKTLGVTLLEATFGADPQGSSSVCQSTWSCRGPHEMRWKIKREWFFGTTGFWWRSFNNWNSGVCFCHYCLKTCFFEMENTDFLLQIYPSNRLGTHVLGGKEKGIDPVSKDGRGELVETKNGQGSLKETRWWSFNDFFIFTFYLGTWSNLTNILQMGFRRFFT